MSAPSPRFRLNPGITEWREGGVTRRGSVEEECKAGPLAMLEAWNRSTQRGPYGPWRLELGERQPGGGWAVLPVETRLQQQRAWLLTQEDFSFFRGCLSLRGDGKLILRPPGTPPPPLPPLETTDMPTTVIVTFIIVVIAALAWVWTLPHTQQQDAGPPSWN